MRLLTRTWNLAHGRTEPETGTTWLEEMVRLVAAQDPNVVCLQEVPVWALSSLGDWSSMRSVGAIAVPSRGGSFGRWLTSLLPLVFRSALTGQANAIHVRQEHAETTPGATIELNGRDFQRTVAATAGLGSAEQRLWARNRRVCQAVEVKIGGVAIVIANMHLTHFDPRLARAELDRALAWINRLAAPHAPVLMGGDLNLAGPGDDAFTSLAERGFSRAGPGIDHLLGRNLPLLRPPKPVNELERTRQGVRMSDHPIIEAEFELA